MKKQPKFNIEVHYSVKNRKRWKLKMWLIFMLLVVILLGCSAMFVFGSVEWDPTEGFSPGPTSDIKWWQELLLVLGALIAIGCIVGYVFYCLKQIKGFYATQEAYFKSKEFKQNKAKAMKVDLKLLKAKDLKWYKKLGYINSSEFRNALEEQSKLRLELKKQGKKIKYAHSRA